MEHYFNSYAIENFEANVPDDEKSHIAQFKEGIFSIVGADQNQMQPIVLNSPHSGRDYPQSFIDGSHLSPNLLRRSEDYYVDALFSNFITHGVPMIRAHFPRAYLDLNREPYELDQRLFAEKLPTRANTKSTRVANGLGTIARLVGEGMAIYKNKLTLDEALVRINALYHPYHEQLLLLLGRTHEKFGYAILVDCHSMPSHFEYNASSNKPDMIIGDRFGNSCNKELTQALLKGFKNLGYNVTCNIPYAGGFNCEYYGRPQDGIHTVQIEINRALYVDEKTYQPLAHFQQLQNDIAHVLTAIQSIPEGCFYPTNMAAE